MKSDCESGKEEWINIPDGREYTKTYLRPWTEVQRRELEARLLESIQGSESEDADKTRGGGREVGS